MAKSTPAPRHVIIDHLKQGLHVHQHSTGWYIITKVRAPSSLCGTDKCIKAKRKDL